VTYTYKVRNTGDVPLAGVKDSIKDDTCSPVKYVSGDKDKDNLLDTPNSIFEDALNETWVFTCTTPVDDTTTNIVTVEGTPTDAAGSPLCGPGSGQDTENQLAPCDAEDRDKATDRHRPHRLRTAGPTLRQELTTPLPAAVRHFG
jgi:hypothetical protein